MLVAFLLVVQSLVALVHDPEPEHPLRAEIAEEYVKDKKKFMKTAEDFTKKHADKRPAGSWCASPDVTFRCIMLYLWIWLHFVSHRSEIYRDAVFAIVIIP